MTDAELIMRSEAKEHKANGRAVYNRASRGGSKHCHLPSDNMTKAQLKKMNGDVIVLQMNKPIPWKEFKKYHPDLQREYLENLVKNYGARQVDIANMFGLEKSYCSKCITLIAPNLFKNHGKKSPDPRWLAFISGETPEIQKEVVEETVEGPIKLEPGPVTEGNTNDSYDNMFVNAMHGNVSLKGDPYAIFARAVKLFDEAKYYNITISFREENEEC